MPINTVYEVFYPEKQFYSVEKAGFVTVSELLYTMVNDILTSGSFRVVRAFYKDTQGGLIPVNSAITNYADWPIGERKFAFVDRGNAYCVGETLILNPFGNAIVTGGTDYFACVVKKIKPTDGSILEVDAVPGARYTTPDPIQPQPLFYSTGTVANIFAPATGVVNLDFEAGNIQIYKQAINTPGVSTVTTPAGGLVLDGGALGGTFNAVYGLLGSGWDSGQPGIGTASSSGDKWPSGTSAIWSLSSTVMGNVKVGQEVFINDNLYSVQPGTVIPPRTLITRISEFNIVTGAQVVGYGNGGTATKYILKKAQNFQLSNVVTLGNNQVISTRGYGATMRNDQLVQPASWDVILESTGAVDPLSDQAGVTANVKTTTTSSNILLVDNMSTINRYRPQLYKGQRLVSVRPLFVLASLTRVGTTITAVTSEPHRFKSTDTVRIAGASAGYNGLFTPTISNANAFTYTVASTPALPASTSSGHTAQRLGKVDGRVFIDKINAANLTHANVSLSTVQSLPANEEVQFLFDDPNFWRLRLRVSTPQVAEVYVGTDLQLSDTGAFSYIWDVDRDSNGAAIGTTVKIQDVAGIMGARPTGAVQYLTEPYITVANSAVDQGFVNRTIRVGAGAPGSPLINGNPETYPLNYTMTITNRGIFFGVWESNWAIMQRRKSSEDAFFNWVLVQRPVDRISGETLTKGRAPLFCINSVGYKYWKLIVREADMQHPTVGDPAVKSFKFESNIRSPQFGNVVAQTTPYRVPADQNSQDSFAILNTAKQIALTEDSKFLVSFLHNLTTPRFRYSEELDMLAQTSADVCMAGNDLAITAYQETLPRYYRAMPANEAYNTGLRIAVLKDIPDLPLPNVT